MKKMGLLLLVTLAVSSSFAQTSERELRRATSIASVLLVTSWPTLLTQELGMTSKGVKNDLMQVEGDAVIAMETGFISAELKSVIDKVRAEYAHEITDETDLEIIETIFGGI